MTKDEKKERSRRWREANPGYYKEYYAKNREQICAHTKERYIKNPGPKLAQRKAWEASNPSYKTQWYIRNKDKLKNKTLLRKYGITLDQYHAMIVQQEGKCAICDVTEPGGNGNFHVDHDHSSGKIRALLCHHCNSALGGFKENSVLLRKAADYLEKFNTKENN